MTRRLSEPPVSRNTVVASDKKLPCERWDQIRFPVTIVRPSHAYPKLWGDPASMGDPASVSFTPKGIPPSRTAPL